MAMSANILTHKRLTELLEYKPDTGEFFWKVSRSTVKAGKKAGVLDKSTGYTRITINRKHYQAHRLAWLYVHQEFPDGMLDHVNRVRHDNRIDNLRKACWILNNRNSTTRFDNKSGVRGVTWHKKARKFETYIKLEGKKRYLGLFDNLELAKEARQFAEEFFWENA
jgi:hypothetical protein